MATYTMRGTAHNVVYQYRNEDGKVKQQWETYETEYDALQRKIYIDHLQKEKRYPEITAAALDYKRKREAVRVAMEQAAVFQRPAPPAPAGDDNMNKTFREFMDKFLPYHARKKRFSPNTYDSYASTLNNHVLPYFGDRIMSTITAEEIDEFIDFLSKKPCRGSKSYNKKADEIPCLSSATVKKCYNVLTVGFPTAKKWNYIAEIPDTSAPPEKTKKRKAWETGRVQEVFAKISDDTMSHFAFHLAFVCSLRAGESAGLEISSLDFEDSSLWVTQIAQRVSDEALAVLPKEDILRVFPKKVKTAKSSLILKAPKTEGSVRKQYLTGPLMEEIKRRLAEIESNKEFFGSDYQDYGLLICNADGSPIEPKALEKQFKAMQREMGLADQIQLQGLRKSGQMHKVRLTKNNFQLVAENAGQSPEVLMSNYNEALDSEKRDMAKMVEESFYPKAPEESEAQQREKARDVLADLESMMASDPAISARVLQLLLSKTDKVS